MRLYNVKGTENDKPNNSDSWLDALEKALGKSFPHYGHVGGHMSTSPNKYGVSNTEYIAYITELENNYDSSEPIDVDENECCRYEVVRAK